MSTSKFYTTRDVCGDPDAPVMVPRIDDLHVGDRVEYVGKNRNEVGDGPFKILELLWFETRDFGVAIIADPRDNYEVNPKNLRAIGV